MKDYTLFDEAHTYFIPKILKGIRVRSSPPDKDAIRHIITKSLCNSRDQEGVLVPGTCKIKCHNGHKVGDPSKTMADISIMGPGPYIPEAVISVDLNTGDKEDVHEKFGLERVSATVTYPPGGPKNLDVFHRRAIESYSTQTYRLAGQSKFREEYLRRLRYLAAVKESLKGAVKSSDYRYASAYRNKYVTITYPNGYTYDMIKLSDVIDIAIKNRTINPETDFVIVQACRTFDGQLPPGRGDQSPGRDGDSMPSVGGRKKKRTRTRTKNRNNRNRNNRNKNKTKKRKRKTIRRKYFI
jgi:hypothetical protein